MAARPTWQGHLKLSLVTCPVALYTATTSTLGCALAGMDLSMQNGLYGEPMKQAVRSGQLAESVVDTMLIRRYTQMFKHGLFDNPPVPQLPPARERGAVAPPGNRGVIRIIPQE